MRHKASHYYALAIAEATLDNSSDSFFEDSIHNATNHVFDVYEFENTLKDDDLFRNAINILVSKGIFICIEDDFGPTVYRKAHDALERYVNWQLETGSTPEKYHSLGDGKVRWLSTALHKINETHFDAPPESHDEWQPIPIDRDNPQFADVEEKIEEALEAIRSDNGFADTFPDERNQVVIALESGLKALKQNTSIHVNYFKAFIIDPLSAAIYRLKDNTAGVVAAVAKGAAIKWLADNIGQNLPDLLRGIF